jgi:signal transduction histidine kinase
MRQEDWIAWPTGPILRGVHFLLGAVGACLLIAMLMVLVTPDEDPNHFARLKSVRHCVDTAVAAPARRADLQRVLGLPDTAWAACRSGVTLPAVFAAEAGAAAGSLARARFRWRFARPADWSSSEPLMFYAPRAMGSAWQLRVDGLPVADNLEDWRMTWNRPIAVSLRPEQFAAGRAVDIELAVVHPVDVDYALSSVALGSAGAVSTLVAWREFLQVTMPQVCSAALILVSAFFFAFWIVRRTETTHLMLALAGVAWSITNLQYVLARPDDPVLEGWYDAIVNLSVCWFMWLLYLFALHFDARRVRWLEWGLPSYVVTMSLLVLPIRGVGDPYESIGFQVVNAAVAAALTLLIGWRALRNGRIELRVISVALLCALVAGTHDVLLLANVADPEGICLLPYGGLLVFASFLFAVQRRYVQAIDEHEQLSASLAHRLAARERELLLNHERLREFENARTLAAERQRLMRDMHDGLGSVLTASLAAVEHGETRPAELAGMLRECVDDLRTVIDSLEPMHQDLVALLASLRFRLEQRLLAAGITLEWHMADLPSLTWMGPPESLHILRIVQEVLSNVIKHARARRVCMSALQHDGEVEICIRDDGCGFDSSGVVAGKGLRFLTQRGSRLGGHLDVETRRGGGTTIRLRLPIDRTPNSHGERVEMLPPSKLLSI